MVFSDCPLDCGYVYVKLNSHTLQILSGLSVRSVTLTPDSLCLRYSKETAEIELEGYVGIDRNLDNVTSASTDGTVKNIRPVTADKDQDRSHCQEPVQETRCPNQNAN